MEFDPVLIAPRRRQMRAQGFWPDRTINDYLAACLAERPDQEALVGTNSVSGEETRLTYRQLAERAERIAGGLVRLGIGAGDVVSYQLPNWWQFTALYLACARIGAVANPLMPIFRHRELIFMLGLAESRLLVVPRVFRGFDYQAMAKEVQAEVPTLERVVAIGDPGPEGFEAVLMAGAPVAGPAPTGPDDVTQLLYTSGTTGEPKGVMHSSNTLISNLLPYAERLGLGSGDVVLMASPMAHQTGFMYGLMMPILLGARAVLQDVWEPKRAAALIAAEGVSFTMASTPFLNDLAEAVVAGGLSLPSLRIFLAAGAPIPRPLVQKAKEGLGAAIVSAWGMTENGAVTTTKLDDPEEKAANTDGCCLPGMAARVVDAGGREVPRGEEGRLLVRGCSLFAGYLKRPEWNNTDAEGWFDTGDLARMDAEGYIRISGRAKDIIIRGGENVPVVEIEGLLFKHPSVAAVAIVGFPDARLGERAVAFVTLREGTSLTFGEMTEFLAQQRIARQYLPERLEIVEELPRTPSGKVQKFKLREVAQAFSPTTA
ncbi:cyclohexanecarboxylate-CoA ligase [Tistlia consotensis]|uniref:3-methylmercaptopropionyl-CoA ligase n=1 Tax=Tistlia consotensis USBA 355 TaxID=560819 RepID=A0A1Y6B547_9PROT|nr:cyclohexanecarboxylate-CoA ligase [Tistlia consotensis]SME90907.1 cyclohexanecarboxylate-CoA ligase [Tistlia consotensis USBA 355]SNR26999.1 cyclohexanecarboxylate-CoA ligase [Tistlia consotensis]